MEIIRVEDTEYKKARAPNELDSGGIGPCIVIGAIYGKKGYMIHGHPVGHNYAAFIEPFFSDLRRDVKDTRKLQLYVIGGELFHEYQDDQLAGREMVLEKIAENGFNEAVKKIQWCYSGHGQSLRLILSEGRAEIEDQEDSDWGIHI
jgi:hypothetical protein